MTAVAAARSVSRARWTSWRTAPSVTPSSRATSSWRPALDRDPQQRLALALRQRREPGQRLADDRAALHLLLRPGTATSDSDSSSSA